MAAKNDRKAFEKGLRLGRLLRKAGLTKKKRRRNKRGRGKRKDSYKSDPHSLNPHPESGDDGW